MKNVDAYISNCRRAASNVCASLTPFKISNYWHTAYSNDKLKILIERKIPQDSRLTASFQHNLDKPAPQRLANLDFNGARDGGVAVASAGPYANHLHLTLDR